MKCKLCGEEHSYIIVEGKVVCILCAVYVLNLDITAMDVRSEAKEENLA